jgi:hypothetical protein
MMQGYGGPQVQASLADILDKVLDKGLVVAGDIRVSLATVELLTIKIRLLVCSIDKAVEVGLDWWRYDSFLTGGAAQQETAKLQARIEALERLLAEKEKPASLPEAASTTGRPRRRMTSSRKQPDAGSGAEQEGGDGNGR